MAVQQAPKPPKKKKGKRMQSRSAAWRRRRCCSSAALRPLHDGRFRHRREGIPLPNPDRTVRDYNRAVAQGRRKHPRRRDYERVDPSVVSITATSLTSNGGSLGSGIVMTEDGYIVTNNHVTEDMDKFTVMLSDGSELNASLVAGDADTDVAVLKADTAGRKLTVPEFGDSDALKPGEAAYAIGTPTAYRLTNTITTGSISAINRNITINDKVMTLIQTDAAINSGNSGGALVNKYGQSSASPTQSSPPTFFPPARAMRGLALPSQSIPQNRLLTS